MNNLKCDKCGSKNIEQTIVQPEFKAPAEQLMSEFKGPSCITTLEYRPVVWHLTCKACGFSLTRSEHEDFNHSNSTQITLNGNSVGNIRGGDGELIFNKPKL